MSLCYDKEKELAVGREEMEQERERHEEKFLHRDGNSQTFDRGCVHTRENESSRVGFVGHPNLRAYVGPCWTCVFDTSTEIIVWGLVSRPCWRCSQCVAAHLSRRRVGRQGVGPPGGGGGAHRGLAPSRYARFATPILSHRPGDENVGRDRFLPR